MIDFTACQVNKFKGYGGANGNKINVLYDGISYMLKFPVMLTERKGKILDYSMELLLKQELSRHEQESSPKLTQEVTM